VRSEEAEAILGPELVARIKARPVKPLTPAQIEILVRLLTQPPRTGRTDTGDA
jgi:hypothetical protein